MFDNPKIPKNQNQVLCGIKPVFGIVEIDKTVFVDMIFIISEILNSIGVSTESTVPSIRQPAVYKTVSKPYQNRIKPVLVLPKLVKRFLSNHIVLDLEKTGIIPTDLFADITQHASRMFHDLKPMNNEPHRRDDSWSARGGAFGCGERAADTR